MLQSLNSIVLQLYILPQSETRLEEINECIKFYRYICIYNCYQVFNILRNVNNYIRCTCDVVGVAAVVALHAPATLVQGM